MGKSKKRLLHREVNDGFSKLTREDAVKEAARLLNDLDVKAYNLITLFGLSAEELLEQGANYETVRNLRGIL